MYTLKSVLVIFNILAIKFVNSELNLPKGSECMTRENVSGVCRNYNECKVIIKQLKSREITHESVTFCQKQYLVVCCPRSAELTPLIVPPIETNRVVDVHSERISERKCKEYGNIVYKNIAISGLPGQMPRFIQTSICQHKLIPLIVGGAAAQSSEFPHQAHLGYVAGTEISWKCGGSIISSDFVLTAAHCINKNLTFVKVGMIFRSVDSNNTATYKVKNTTIHPNYKSLIDNEDIALVQLQSNIEFNEHVYPICLPTKENDQEKAIVSGFGNLGNGVYSERLLKVVVEKFDHQECKDLYEPKTIFQDTMLCFGDKQNPSDSCDGDSGGPLQISNEHNVYCTYTQIGIVSFGSSQCGIVGFPAVYVNVFNYIDWIEMTVWPGEK
ncbi:hypothetical protein ACKWTF_001043 [Chironomus riparius]